MKKQKETGISIGLAFFIIMISTVIIAIITTWFFNIYEYPYGLTLINDYDLKEAKWHACFDGCKYLGEEVYGIEYFRNFTYSSNCEVKCDREYLLNE